MIDETVELAVLLIVRVPSGAVWPTLPVIETWPPPAPAAVIVRFSAWAEDPLLIVALTTTFPLDAVTLGEAAVLAGAGVVGRDLGGGDARL